MFFLFMLPEGIKNDLSDVCDCIVLRLQSYSVMIAIV